MPSSCPTGGAPTIVRLSYPIRPAGQRAVPRWPAIWHSTGSRRVGGERRPNRTDRPCPCWPKTS